MATVTFHVYPAPRGRSVLVDVREGRQSLSVGTFKLTVEGWRQVRDRLTPGPGVRIVDYPP